MQRVNDGQCARQVPADEKDSPIVIGQVVDDSGKTETEHARQPTPARRVFTNGFERTINQMAGEVLSTAVATALLTDIVSYTRAHADVERGASVRGTIAFDEVAHALARLNGGLTVECIGKAAMITLPPRVTVRAAASAAALIRDIANEVLYGVRLSGKIDRSEGEEAASPRPEDIEGSSAEPKKKPTRKAATIEKSESFAVVPEIADSAKSGAGIEHVAPATQNMQERYLSAKRELLSLISDLEAKLHAGEITQEEFERHAAGLMAKFRDSVRSAMRMSEGELASTIVQMMDAQDKQWNNEVSFGTMQVYYHIKGTSDRVDLGPFKQDYHALKWLIDDLQTGNILRQGSDASGFLLTGVALEVLLKHLMDRRGNESASRTTRGLDGLSMIERSHEVRRYSRGDRFHDLSVRHTLREIARRKISLSEVRESDLRVLLKERRRPHSDIVLCIDTSGSMGFGQRLTCARLVAAGLVKAAFNDGDRAGVVGFGDRGQTVVPLTKDDGEPLMNGIAALSANGNTNIGDGIKAATELLLASGSRNRKQIILITDGQASAVSEAAFQQLSAVRERDITQESALHETKKAAAAGVQVSVVYIAPRDEEIDLFIRKIAETGRGRIQRMSGLEDLENVLCRPTRPSSQAGRTRGL